MHPLRHRPYQHVGRETQEKLFPDPETIPALRVGLKWKRIPRARSSYPLSHHHIYRPRNNMKLPKLLRLPKSHRRSRSKARSEIGPIEGQSEGDSTWPYHIPQNQLQSPGLAPRSCQHLAHRPFTTGSPTVCKQFYSS